MPRAFLDPRRPVVAAATPEMREEGIMPYLPELPIPAEAIINYNQTISNIKSIYVTPSSLESTALVFVCGLGIIFISFFVSFVLKMIFILPFCFIYLFFYTCRYLLYSCDTLQDI